MQPAAPDHDQSRIVIAGAVHVDRTGWLDAPSTLGCSNPARFDEMPGGTTLNFASILAAMGHNPIVLTQLGNDHYAAWLQEIAVERGFFLLSGKDTLAKTGTYTSVIEPDGSLLIGLADMAVYNHFTTSEFSRTLADMQETSWLGIDANLPVRELEKLLASGNCRKFGLTVSKAKAPKLKSMLEKLDLLFTNQTEAAALLGLEVETGIEQLVAGVRNSGVKAAVISHGDQVVAVLDNGLLTQVPVPRVVNVIDVTGAGDALAAATLHGLFHGMPLVSAVQFGIGAAEKIIQVEGAYRADLAEVLPRPQGISMVMEQDE